MPSPSEDVRNGRKAKVLPNDTGLFEAAQRFWQKSYAGDYVVLVVIAAVFMFIKLFNEPFHQMFVLNDIRIQHPWAEVERVDVCKLVPHSSILFVLVPNQYTQ